MQNKYYDFPQDNSENIIYLSENGWSEPYIGTWNEKTKTGKLISDIQSTIKIVSSNITLDGNGHKTFNCDNGILVEKQDNLVIKNIKFANKFNGIAMYYTNNSKIINTSIIDSEEGIFLNKCNNNTISGNSFSGDKLLIGINLFNSENNNIEINSITSPRDYGIILESCNNNILYNNDFNNCRVSILCEVGKNNSIIYNTINKGDIGINLLGNNEGLIEANHVYQVNTSAIVVKSCYDINIYQNACSNSKDKGITIEESNDIVLDENICENNNIGIYINKCTDSKILKSKLIFCNNINISIESIVTIK